MVGDRTLVGTEPFEGLDELISVLQDFQDDLPGEPIAVESDGFALQGWAALFRIENDPGEDAIYTVELCDKMPSRR